MKRDALGALLLGLGVLLAGCGERRTDQPAAVPTAPSPARIDAPSAEGLPEAGGQTVSASAEATGGTPSPVEEVGAAQEIARGGSASKDAESRESPGEVSQRKVMTAVARSLFRSLGGGTDRDQPEEAPRFEP